MAGPSILQKQARLVEEFTAIADWEERYQRLIERGKRLDPLSADEHSDGNKVRGCSSSVWLVAGFHDGVVHLRADSDAVLVRGLVQILVEVYSGHPPSEILAASSEFLEEMGLNANLSPNRANGLGAMARQIRIYAAAFAGGGRIPEGTAP